MKKLFSFAVALALCFGLTAPALAAGKPGDTTVQDAKGNTYTLSKPILYTIPVDELDGVQEQDFEGFFGRIKEEVSVIYAVSHDTLITAPNGICFDGILGTFIEEENGSLYTVAPIGPGPRWTAFQLEEGWEGGLFMFPCLTAEEQLVDYIAFFVPLDETAGDPFAAAPAQPADKPADAPAFTDVPAGTYFTESVAWAVAHNITSGTNTGATAPTFSPEQTCTTAQILTFLWRAKGCPEPTDANTFTDIQESDYFYKAAVWAKENGLVSGTAFKGNTPCTRSMVMTYLWELAGRPAVADSGFADVPSGAAYAQAVSWAVQQGITGGTGNNCFSPDAICTRAQIVTFLYRAYK